MTNATCPIVLANGPLRVVYESLVCVYPGTSTVDELLPVCDCIKTTQIESAQLHISSPDCERDCKWIYTATRLLASSDGKQWKVCQ